MTRVISIAKEFSDCPAGRYRKDGPDSGERFRDELLYPALSKGETVEVDLDGSLGYGSSFLEEAFGGLVRERGLSASELRQRLKIKSSISLYPQRIWNYIEDADRLRAH